MLVRRDSDARHKPSPAPRPNVDLVDGLRVLGLILIAVTQRKRTIGEVIVAIVRNASKGDE